MRVIRFQCVLVIVYCNVRPTYYTICSRPILLTTRAGLRELEALGEVNLVAPNEIEKYNYALY